MTPRGFAGLAGDGSLPRPRSAPCPEHLERPVAASRRVAQGLAELRPRPVRTIGDLLHHLPSRHEDYRSVKRLGELAIGEEATVLCEVVSVRLRPTRRRNLQIVEAHVRDASGPAVLMWFNQRYLLRQLRPGTLLSARGERSASIGAEIVVKQHELIGPEADLRHTAGLVPVYPASERVSSRQLRELAREALAHAGDEPDVLPAAVKQRQRLPLLRDALTAGHAPRAPAEVRPARRRLAFDELFLLATGLIEHRRLSGERVRARPLPAPGALVEGYVASLPFTLTGAQRRAMGEIDADLARERPMARLLQGDVGAGKTAVALYALLRAVEADGQGALMAPTETLATQHLLTLSALCEPLGVRVLPLVNAMPARERRAAQATVAGGEPLVVVGTHALIQEAVVFGRLDVAVVDEQHRFGVEQRRALEEKAAGGRSPHVLHMTATPIPRTLALTVYGDLDVSTLDELPAGRRPIVTRAVPTARRDEVFARMRRLLDEGRQAYVVCPLVAAAEEDEPGAAAAEEEAARLAEGELRDYRVGCIHGQMPAAERRAAMDAFRRGEIQVLVATTVIEVGVDVANAVLMVIEEADLFGLAQLHQLRGRVGRGGHESYCILLADPATDEARRRLDAMVRSQDGFELAEVDLELRGEGTILSARQSGMPDLRHARLARDRDLAARARREAERFAAGAGREPAQAALVAEAARRAFGEELDWLTRA